MPVALELIVSILVFYGCVHIEGATVNCPTPVSPENGQLTLYNQGKIVKYVCDPGYILQGTSIVQCVQNQWTSPPPVCNPEGKKSSPPSQKDRLAAPERPLFSWSPDKEEATENDTSADMISDEARLHMVLYPERAYRRVRVLPSRIRTAAVRVQSGSELEEEQKKRSKEETTVELQPPVVYVRKSATPSKTVIYDDTLRRQYEIAALHLESVNNKPDVAVVSLPRAAVSTDDKGGQSEESLRQMYVTAHNYLYPRQAIVDPANNPVVLTLSESQMMWINSLHPELRERYLKDIYTTRAKEAEEGARAMEFLRRYEDSYNVYYNRPYFVRQPVAVVVEDPVASYDYSCHRANYYGEIETVRAPQLPNARIYRMEGRRNDREPFNHYLSTRYVCKRGYRLRDSRVSELFCRNKSWVGETPICDPTGE